MDSVAGIDIGGTFTDVAVWDAAAGELRTHKVLTSEHGLGEAIAEALRLVGVPVTAVVHGTTLVTNALIERRGAVVGMVTTAGYRDVLEIANELRYDTFDLTMRRPEPLVPRWLRMSVTERIAADGSVVVGLDSDAVLKAGRELVSAGARSLVVAFFNAHANPLHEQVAAQLLQRALPEISISSSSDVSNEMGEYERFSTAAANAYVQPLVSGYLQDVAETVGSPVFPMLSDGTITSLAEACQHPIKLVESGPAAGATAIGRLAAAAGWPRVIALDMGGTTAKVSLVHNGLPQLARSLEVARIHRLKKGSGLPLSVPTVELLEIGAGGGSIAHVDRMGLLHVGPRSAGASPGPACYGRGGTEATVTDADLHLGYLSSDGLVGGRLQLDPKQATTALASVAAAVNMTVTQLAAGVGEIVDTHMADAIRIHLAEHGRDPRRYRLVAIGGAGPVHACSIAERLGVEEVVFPRDAGVASAIGMLQARRGVEYVKSLLTRLDWPDWRRLTEALGQLEAAARALLLEAGVAARDIVTEISADVRYVGQGQCLNVPLGHRVIDSRDTGAIQATFVSEYIRQFGRSLERIPVEVISWRLRATGPPVLNSAAQVSRGTGGVGRPSTTSRPAFFRSGATWIEVPVRRRDQLPAAAERGPFIIEEPNTTIVVPPRWCVGVDRLANIVARREHR